MKQTTVALKILVSVVLTLALPNPVRASSSFCANIFASPTHEHLLVQKKFELFSSRAHGRLVGLPEKDTPVLFRALRDHPVASVNRLGSYDPKGLIGFCFGRSFAAYLIARQMGLQVAAIRNLFIIGDLRSGTDPEWRFHVTNVVKLSNGQWYAFDPIIPQTRPVPIAEWAKVL